MAEDSKSNSYMIHKAMAVVLDVIVMVSFAVIGLSMHEDKVVSLENVILVVLPFAGVFFALMLVVSPDLRSIKSAAICSVIAVPLAVLLKIQYETAEFPFILVAMIYLTGLFTGWRFLLAKLRPSTPSES